MAGQQPNSLATMAGQQPNSLATMAGQPQTTGTGSTNGQGTGFIPGLSMAYPAGVISPVQPSNGAATSSMNTLSAPQSGMASQVTWPGSTAPQSYAGTATTTAAPGGSSGGVCLAFGSSGQCSAWR
jgi:hypothetical protein